ncbi:endonuclease/exonuclease/phosphatase family protein [Streptomyces sp. NBC_00328]|uniref:endonuclease/exonuclease/phosphatase family protein n=1 Tax=Streptomyces sp. NBC_00328 TaxID=2903646 RepID=UPI002E2A8922|nr:endonuclease/exonuclease/phosphatase family protein [Streptomyces sp. NBC_00328]
MPASASEISEDADAVSKSAGQKWALKTVLTGKYVSVGMNETDEKEEWILRAQGAAPKKWELFTLHTNHAGYTIGMRFIATGFFASSEFSDVDPRTGLLRARGIRLGQWQQFYPEYLNDAPPPGSPPGSVVVALGTKEADTDPAVKYVSADLSASGDGRLRSRASKIGSWEKFVLEPVPNEEGAADESENPPAVTAAPADKVNVMTWNVCANAKQCTWSGGLAGYEELADGIQARLRNPGNNELPDVIFFQEFCEKHAKRIEWMLEKPVSEGGTGRGWDVRFAPIHQQAGSGPLIQKQCSITDKDGQTIADRGAYGVAIAVPDTNTWYKRYDLPSPEFEKRTAVCAVMPAQALATCSAHLSSGYTEDDPNATYRSKQAQKLVEITKTYEKQGYRVVFGGDFNLVPPYPDADLAHGGPSDTLNVVYDSYQECGQLGDPGALRGGKPTANGADGHPTRKLDYIFSPKNAPISDCTVSATTGHSDHWTLYGSVHLPTG